MKNKIRFQTFAAILAIVFFGLPMLAQAQFSPPSGSGGMTPPTGYEGMMPPNMGSAPGGGPTMGPPSDMQDKMNLGLKRLKGGVAGMKRAVKAMEKAVAGAQKTGYTVPADILASIESAKAAIQTILDATEINDTVQDAIDQFTAFTEVLDANIENLMLMARFPKVLSAADRSYQKLVKFFETTKARLTKMEIDITETVANVQAKIDALKGVYTKAEALFKEGKMEEAFAELEDNFFPNLEDASQSVGVLNAMKALTRTASSVKRGLSTAKRIVTKVEKAGLDASALKQIIADSEKKLEEFKALIKTPNFDLEQAMALLEDMDMMREDFEIALDEIVGDEDIGKIPQIKMFQGPKIPMPMDMRGGFDQFRDKAIQGSGFSGEGSPSDSFGFGPDMMNGGGGFGPPMNY